MGTSQLIQRVVSCVIPHTALKVIMAGDALKPEEVEATHTGVDLLIRTLGVGLRDLFRSVHLLSDATRALIKAMRRQVVKGLIYATGFGTGDSCARINCLQRLPFQILFGSTYDDESLQEK